MSSQSSYAGSCGSSNFSAGGTGSAAWSGTANGTGAPDGSFVTNADPHTSPANVTPSLDFYGWSGFSISGTVNGIAATFTAKDQLGGTAGTFNQTWVEAGSAAGNFTASGLAGTVLTSSSATYSTGSSTDLCGISSSLTASNCNSATENVGLTIGAAFKNTAVASQTISVDACQATVYFTASSPPGTPTGLTASNAGPTSVGLSWTQGSGAVTDDPIEYQAAGAGSWTTVDPGSAVTSYTITGLTFGQLYFFQVAAENTGGTSSYTSPVPWVCGSTWTGQVLQSSDDALQSGAGSVSLTDTTDSIGGVSTYAGWRFQSVAIAQGVGVNAAYLYLYVTATASSGSAPLDCQLSTSAATFAASTDNISNRTLTGHSVSVAASSLSAGWSASPNIAVPVEAVLAQSGWSSGDAIVPILGAGTGGPTVEMFDGNGAEAAILAIFVDAGQYQSFSDDASNMIGTSLHFGAQHTAY